MPVRVVEALLQTEMNKLPSASVAIIIFVRHPEIGKVKTRLAKSIGDEKALQIYKKLLQHTLDITSAVEAAKFVFYTEEIQEQDLWSKPNYTKCKQDGTDLGERMKNAFSFVFSKGFTHLVIVGSDCYQLKSNTIELAFSHLADNDFVLGPAVDGGYYLLGMNRLYSEVFENKIWSTSHVAEQTISDVERLGLSFKLLQTLNDVDEVEDLAASGITID